MKRYSSKSVKGKLDKIIGEYFRSRPCDKCKTKGKSCWAHIKSRRYLSTRWLLINAFSLCAGCHRWAHDNPDDFMRWIDLNYPTRLDELQKVFILNRGYKEYELVELYENLTRELSTLKKEI